MNDDYWTAEAMILNGGGFVRRLGELFKVADQYNRQAIKDAWPGYWSDFSKQGQQLKSDEAAKQRSPCNG